MSVLLESMVLSVVFMSISRKRFSLSINFLALFPIQMGHSLFPAQKKTTAGLCLPPFTFVPQTVYRVFLPPYFRVMSVPVGTTWIQVLPGCKTISLPSASL